jgi:hypothetical protein
MKANLPHRIIFDSPAIITLHESLTGEKFAYFLYNLTYVNTNSDQHKKNHIITSKRSFDLITAKLKPKLDNRNRNYNFLESAIRPQINPPEIEKIDDEIIRIWEHAIFVSSEYPYKSIVFTKEENVSAYETLRAKDKKENISIRSCDDSFNLIDDYREIIRQYKSS